MAIYTDGIHRTEAMQWDGTERGAIPIIQWCEGMAALLPPIHAGNATWPAEIRVQTSHGIMSATKGDYIIKGDYDEFTVNYAWVFESKFKLVED